MLRAVALAAESRGRTLPNPAVGCVVLDAEGVPVGEGWHRRAGGPHAEVLALAAAGSRAGGGTAVVTLEPCAHTGRTGPCTQALLSAGIARVVVGVPEPSSTAGGGAERLRAAGVDVQQMDGPERDAAEVVNAVWLTAVRRRRPYLTWKLASTLDGRVAAADGSSRWITGAAARADVHRLRAECDTVLVGVGTVLADDPSLTVRPHDGSIPGRQPLRVVADTHGRTPSNAQVRDSAATTWVATADQVGSGPDGRVDLRSLLTELYERERRHVLLEGGPTLAGAAVAAGLVDRVVAYLAPALLGDGRAALGAAGVSTISATHRLELVDVRRVGDDVRIEATPLPRP
ncbi:MAG: bifunctional diaminohydroxyphosphoribosylaminopyrimidine deaminase/5-amino-6-(5-phosphoribosylamino)uracil reductase RibD [Actinomycetota bacterium]|nr:bifunctional diaminohydroxyphosphoribosylaminopyrimidine deaminase/5-amino-6-(5-phosphoribosylamino)uracil reductase RibD [Actinomycetota bacterium]